MITFDREEIERVYDFAGNMVNNHNPNMIMDRENWEIYRDDIRGKLGELALRKYIEQNMPNATINTDIDYSVTPRGQWDITDLVVNDNYINVKSIKGNSKFLLVETDRYDENGNYRYNNNNGENVRVDSYVLVRVVIEPDVCRGDFNNRNKFNSLDIFLNNAWNAREKKEVNRKIYAEVLGGISHDEFLRIKSYAPRGIRCSVQNLNAITRGVDINNLPDQVRPDDRPNNILQRDNYVINSDNQLLKIEDILR